MTDIKDLLTNYSTEFNSHLEGFFPTCDSPENRVIEAMKYSIMNGGKRLRPFLVTETAKLFGLDFADTLRPAVALECIHSYSLIHDDLPAMDNDDLRRGKPTCHKAFDEATAILAGDGLLTYAFAIISDEKTHPSSTIRCQLINLLANAAGAFNGMVAGQMLDLYAENNITDNSEKLIKNIEEMKTGRLIRYACESGAILGQASIEETQALINYSRKIGIAFQIADDILDVEGEQSLVGKTLHKDASQGKQTFVSLYGLDQAKQLAQQHVNEAKESISPFGNKANTLQTLSDFIITRSY